MAVGCGQTQTYVLTQVSPGHCASWTDARPAILHVNTPTGTWDTWPGVLVRRTVPCPRNHGSRKKLGSATWESVIIHPIARPALSPPRIGLWQSQFPPPTRADLSVKLPGEVPCWPLWLEATWSMTLKTRIMPCVALGHPPTLVPIPSPPLLFLLAPSSVIFLSSTPPTLLLARFCLRLLPLLNSLPDWTDLVLLTPAHLSWPVAPHIADRNHVWAPPPEAPRRRGGPRCRC